MASRWPLVGWMGMLYAVMPLPHDTRYSDDLGFAAGAADGTQS